VKGTVGLGFFKRAGGRCEPVKTRRRIHPGMGSGKKAFPVDARYSIFKEGRKTFSVKLGGTAGNDLSSQKKLSFRLDEGVCVFLAVYN